MSRPGIMDFMGIVDTAGNPVFRVHQGADGEPAYTLLGRKVVTCADYLPTYDTAAAGQVYAWMYKDIGGGEANG